MPKKPSTFKFRCGNRWGDSKLGLLPCAQYGAKKHPDNIVELEVSKLPPRGIAPKCPNPECGVDLAALSGLASRSSGSRGHKGKIAIALAAAAAVVACFLVSRSLLQPKIQVAIEKISLNTVRPSQSIEVANNGRALLRVQFKPGRDSISVQPATLQIEPGQKASVACSIDPSATSVTRIDSVIALESNDPKAPSMSVPIAWRNLELIIEDKFKKAHADLYSKPADLTD